MNAATDTSGIGGSGYTLEQLSDYLERGRVPAIAEIDTNPECEAMLASLARVGAMSRELVAQDAADNPAIDEGWLSGLLDTIGRELRAGRDIPLVSPDEATRLVITEGAVRELVRAAGDSVDGVLVGRCELDSELDDPAASVRVHLTISVVLSAPVKELAQQVRDRVTTELFKHTQLRVEAVDITITDVHQFATQIESDES